ncbi:O-antigen ligase family protein [Salinispirillum sp. LH 10-3-1]|uniref:O-antigen ligase family protein n=1 Tax=Salinispirillum sp. LH 10-3-1 TaxID=2952525 RepID=A0AB38YJ18_9GAMM
MLENQVFFSKVGFFLKQNWVELSILLFIALFPFGEVMHVALLPLFFYALRHLFVKELYQQPWMRAYLLLLALLFVPILLSTFTALVLDRHLEVVIQWAFYIVVGIFLVSRFRQRMNESLLLYGVAGLIMLSAFDGIMQFLLGFNMLGNPMVGGRVTSFFYPRVRMTDLAYLSPFVFEAIRRFAVRGGLHRLAWLLVLPLAISVFLGGSRSAWIVMALMAVIYIAYLLYRREFPVLMFVLVCLGAVLTVYASIQMSSGVKGRVDRTLLAFTGNAEDLNRATTTRIDIYKDAITVISQYPWLGVGRYGFKESELFVSTERQGGAHRQAHLIILDVPVNTGLVGLVGYILAFGWLVALTWRAARERNGMAFAMAAATSVLMMPLNTAYGFYDVRPAALGLILLSLTFVYLPKHEAAPAGVLKET